MFKYSRINKFSLYILTASVSMAVLIVMQVFWVTNAYQLKAELLEHKINVALKSIVNHMIEQKYTHQKDVFYVHYCKFHEQDIVEHIDPLLLDSIVEFELKSLKIDMAYNYAVYRAMDSLYVIGAEADFVADTEDCKYSISLSCVSSDNSFYFGIQFQQKNYFLLKQILIWLILNLLLFFLIILSYYKTVLYYLKLKKIYAIKADFINNLTHEFKTPIATIAIAGEMLRKQEVLNDSEKRNKYNDIIQNENKRLKAQVDQILQIAMIEKGELPLNLEVIDAHEWIKYGVSNFMLMLNQKGGNIKLELKADNFLIKADKVHFANMLSNLLDNAVKYTDKIPEIHISTENEGHFIVIKISDNGIGIPKEHIQHIFKQFFRVPKGNVHDVKGFGLGLFYVKTLTELFKAKILVQSDFEKGTLFTLKFYSA